MKRPSPTEVITAIKEWENRKWDFKAPHAIGNPKIMANSVVDKKDWELSRDIASFANSNGGNIVIGVEDDRKERKLVGFSIDDPLKNRLSRVIRNRISPVPNYDIINLRVRGKDISIINIDEGDYDLCVVNGAVFIRDINGRSFASGPEITRIIKKRIGKRVIPAPTEKDIVNSPYNLPIITQQYEALLKDFKKIAPNYGYSKIKKLGKYLFFSGLKKNNRNWHFIIIPHEGNFGTKDLDGITGGYVKITKDIMKKPSKYGVKKNAEIYPLILIIGRINSLKSKLKFYGMSLVPTNFGGYVGPGDFVAEFPIGNYQSHKFLLSGITDVDIMEKRLESFVKWLKNNQTQLCSALKR